MSSELTFSRPDFFILVTESEGKWTAFGSRKINQFNLEYLTDLYTDLYTDFDSYPKISTAHSPELTIQGSMRGSTVVIGTSPLAAVGALLDLFREEEKQELLEIEARAQSVADYKRFGGEVNEELIKKVIRWRKKQAKKELKQRELDAEYDDKEWDFD